MKGSTGYGIAKQCNCIKYLQWILKTDTINSLKWILKNWYSVPAKLSEDTYEEKEYYKSPDMGQSGFLW